MERESEDFFGGVAKIALGIFFGGLLVWLAIEARARYELRQLERAAQAEIQRMNDAAAAAADRRAKQSRAIEALQRDQAQKAATARNAALQEQRRKESAWAAFYQPAPQCLQTTSVECGNAHMRARKEFERRYAAGEL